MKTNSGISVKFSLMAILFFASISQAAPQISTLAGVSYWQGQSYLAADTDFQPWQWGALVRAMWGIPNVGISEDYPMAVGIVAGYQKLFTGVAPPVGQTTRTLSSFTIPVLLQAEFPMEYLFFTAGAGVHAWFANYEHESPEFIPGNFFPEKDNSIDLMGRLGVGAHYSNLLLELAFMIGRRGGEIEESAMGVFTMQLGYRFRL